MTNGRQTNRWALLRCAPDNIVQMNFLFFVGGYTVFTQIYFLKNSSFYSLKNISFPPTIPWAEGWFCCSCLEPLGICSQLAAELTEWADPRWLIYISESWCRLSPCFSSSGPQPKDPTDCSSFFCLSLSPFSPIPIVLQPLILHCTWNIFKLL